ncbi:hypothetical protein KM043_004749 [Ampulex compressa]|nr:hypothetical protein KM043_004749 [Ampulex compressa]
MDSFNIYGHSLERFFWLAFCALGWYGCITTTLDVLQEYTYNPVAVTVESTYLSWQTPFPAVAFCITSISFIRSNYFLQHPGTFANYSYPSGVNVTAQELVAAYEQMPISCRDFIVKCSWNGVEFDCCQEFGVLPKTGIGYCVAMNSYHLGKVKFFVNRTVQYADLIIDLNANKTAKAYIRNALDVYLINNLQLPSLETNNENRKIRIKADYISRVYFTMTDMYNAGGVNRVPMEQRYCRFSHEVPHGSFFNIYSRSSCKVETYIRKMLDICGCVHFYYFLPHGARVCNMTELQCLMKNKQSILFEENNLNCYPDCDGTALDINRIDPAVLDDSTKDVARIHFSLLVRPTLRYRRYVIRDLLDVVVSVGGAIGLFVGASILSFFEIPYWLFIRHDRVV